jgi:hypothetical protein
MPVSPLTQFLTDKHLGLAPLFDPQDGVTIKEPLKRERGYWAGAPSVIYDNLERKYFLYYRVRQPRPIRGGEVRIAVSNDGMHFEDIWSCRREQLESDSIERGAIMRTGEGAYRLYISYVDPADQRWRIDMMEAQSPDSFRPERRQKILTAEAIGAEGVKDPWLMVVGGMYYMIVSYAPRPELDGDSSLDQMHCTGDIFNTGITKSSTGLALSADGIHFKWQGDIFAPQASGWDSYASRIGALLYVPPVFTAFYDGSADVSANYEEQVGLAVSTDLKSFFRLTNDGPCLVSPHGSGSLRYIDVVRHDDEVRYYYEYARSDGSHELRLNKVRI